MATFDLNPHNGNINLSTNDALKLFLKLTKECKEDAKLKISQSNVKILMSAFESDVHKLGWSALVSIIPSDKTEQNKKSILKNFSEVTIKMAKKKARMIWGYNTAAFGNDLPQVMNITTIDPPDSPTHLPFLIVKSN